MPMSTPARIGNTMATATGTLAQTSRPATRTPDSPATSPTERSNSPLATATVSPDEMIISTEICTRMLLMLLTATNLRLQSAKTAKISTAAATVP